MRLPKLTLRWAKTSRSVVFPAPEEPISLREEDLSTYARALRKVLLQRTP